MKGLEVAGCGQQWGMQVGWTAYQEAMLVERDSLPPLQPGQVPASVYRCTRPKGHDGYCRGISIKGQLVPDQEYVRADVAADPRSVACARCGHPVGQHSEGCDVEGCECAGAA